MPRSFVGAAADVAVLVVVAVAVAAVVTVVIPMPTFAPVELQVLIGWTSWMAF